MLLLQPRPHLLAMNKDGVVEVGPGWGQEEGLFKQNVFAHTHKTTGLLEASTLSGPLILESIIRSM